MIEEEIKLIVKAPRYFLVHFYEHYAIVDGQIPMGSPFPVCYKNKWLNVYGVPATERENFNPLSLLDYLGGTRHVEYLWIADDEADLMNKLDEDKDYNRGILTLHEGTFLKGGVIEHLPECEKMHLNPATGDLFCGKPLNEYSDGCMGGCVIQGYDQEEEFSNGFKCPMHMYWKALHEKRKAA